jgi:ATP-dependent DNA ligase
MISETASGAKSDHEQLCHALVEASRCGAPKLEALIAGHYAIMFSKSIEAAGELVFAKACEMSLEGIVSKRLGSAHWSGRCRNWLRVKNPAFVRGWNLRAADAVAIIAAAEAAGAIGIRQDVV